MKKLIINPWDIFWNLKILQEIEKTSHIRKFKVKCIKCWKIKDILLHSLIKSKTWCKCSNSWWNKPKKIYTKIDLQIKKLKTILSAIEQRCNNKNHKAYKNYWWRWIKCEWKNFEEFKNDMYDSYKEWLTIDRIDVNWNYCKNNCRWVSYTENNRNKRNNIIIEWITLPEFCEKFNLNYKQTVYRIHRWYTIQQLKYNNYGQ